MERTLIRELKEKIGEEVLVKGWIANVRDKSKIKFLVLRDRSGETQGVALGESCEKSSFDLISKLYRETCVEIKGKIKKSPQAKQGYEIEVINLKVLAESEPKLPIDVYGKIESSLDKRLDNRFLDTRRPEINAIFKIRSQIYKATVEYMDSQDFTKIATPKITVLGLETPSDGDKKQGSDLFTLNYFGKDAYLAQSPQLYKEMFVAGGFERVYEIGTVFRAEKSHTTRHVTEFTGIDFEMGFIEGENDVMDITEGLMIHITTKINENCKQELELLSATVPIPKKIPRLDFPEIRNILKGKGKDVPEDDDLDSEGEKLLSEYVKEKYGEEFVFALNYPFVKRPFYTMKSGENGSRSFDLIYNGVEIGTGSQREHRLSVLGKQASEKGMDIDSMKDYTLMFKYGYPPHGGVGLGLDRITEKLLKLDNIREAILLPRDPERLKP